MPSIIIPQNNQILFPVGTTLPKSAAEKLVRLETELADWNSLTSTTVERLRELEERTLIAQQRVEDAKRAENQTWERQASEELESLMSQRRALSPTLSLRNARSSEITAVFTGIRAWASTLVAGTRFEQAPEQAIGSKPVTAERVLILREEISKLEAERSAVEVAPPAADELKATIVSTVTDLAASAAPDLSRFLKGKGAIVAPDLKKRWGAVGAIKFEGEFDGLSLLAWLDPDTLIARLSAEVDANRKDPSAELTSDERAKKLADIDVQMLALERQEEALIDAAKDQGVDIARRPNASPLALLGVVFGEKSSAGGAAMLIPKIAKEAPKSADGFSYGIASVTQRESA